MAAVGEHEHGALNAAQEFLNDHTGRGIAKLAAEHIGQLLLRLLKGVEDEHALARTEAIGLEHVGRLKGFEESLSRFELCTIEGFVGGSRNAVALHKGFGKIL